MHYIMTLVDQTKKMTARGPSQNLIDYQKRKELITSWNPV